MKALAIFLIVGMSGQAVAEEACFRTVREAAAGVGVRDGVGFRLEGVKVDGLGGGRWATVRWCAQPERPAVLVRMPGSAPLNVSASARTEPAKVAAVTVVAAGAPVLVIQTEALLRMEMPGRAEAGGAVGDRIRVRLAGDRVVEAVIRGAGLVGLEAGR